MRTLIIFGIALMLAITGVSAFEVLEELTDNEILDLSDNLNLDASYESYAINDETLIFYFNLDDYRRTENNGEFTNTKVRNKFEASLDVNAIVSCLDDNEGDYCYDTFINGNEKVIIANGDEEKDIAPIKMQLNEEITAVRNKVESYKGEIRRDRNPIINFIESLNIGAILG